MTITLYETKDERNKFAKTLLGPLALNGQLKDDFSLVDFTLLIEGDPAVIQNKNYLHVTTFGRYYFIEEQTIVRNNLVSLRCHEDVLMSWPQSILSCQAIVSRQQKNTNTMINDEKAVLSNRPYVYQLESTGAFTAHEHILLVAGR